MRTFLLAKGNGFKLFERKFTIIADWIFFSRTTFLHFLRLEFSMLTQKMRYLFSVLSCFIFVAHLHAQYTAEDVKESFKKYYPPNTAAVPTYGQKNYIKTKKTHSITKNNQGISYSLSYWKYYPNTRQRIYFYSSHQPFKSYYSKNISAEDGSSSCYIYGNRKQNTSIKTTNYYNEDHQLIKTVRLVNDSDTSSVGYYIYDSLKRLSEILDFYEGKKSYSKKFIYDESGRIHYSLEIKYSKDNPFSSDTTSCTELQYNEKSWITRATFTFIEESISYLGPDKDIYITIDWRYDLSGNVLFKRWIKQEDEKETYRHISHCDPATGNSIDTTYSYKKLNAIYTTTNLQEEKSKIIIYTDSDYTRPSYSNRRTREIRPDGQTLHYTYEAFEDGKYFVLDDSLLTYNSKGQLIKTVRTRTSREKIEKTESETTYFSYNSKGLIKKRKQYFEHRFKDRTRYRYCFYK
jgi:hypothetical protein